jgi:hypothetical protein
LREGNSEKTGFDWSRRWLLGHRVVYNEASLGNDRYQANGVREITMAHAVPIHSHEQFVEAIRVLDQADGTWQGVGSSSARVLLLTDAQCNALVAAGVVSPNDREVKTPGKKKTGNRTKS